VNGDIPIKDIPQNVLDDVILLLKNYLVAVYIVLPEKQQSRPRPIGSGTFVEIEGTHYILTAAHVWHKARESEKIGLVLTDYQSSFMVLRDAIPYQELWDGKVSEWGPDITLLKLAPSDVATIKAHKSFLNLAQQKEALAACPPVIEKGLWAVTGMVGEFTGFNQIPRQELLHVTSTGKRSFLPCSGRMSTMVMITSTSALICNFLVFLRAL